jgi:hypothetical protein
MLNAAKAKLKRHVRAEREGRTFSLNRAKPGRSHVHGGRVREQPGRPTMSRVDNRSIPSGLIGDSRIRCKIKVKVGSKKTAVIKMV